MDKILKKEGYDMEVVTYRCVPTSTNDGIIEIVPNSETLFHIENVKKFFTNLTQQSETTLLNWILDNNNRETIDEVRERIVKSTAAYCVFTYLLGVGKKTHQPC